MTVEQLRSDNDKPVQQRQTPKVDLVVHIDEALGEQGRQDMEAAVEQDVGVMQARFNDVRHHLMIIGYDPGRTSSTAILRRIRRQRVHAQLIGGI